MKKRYVLLVFFMIITLIGCNNNSKNKEEVSEEASSIITSENNEQQKDIVEIEAFDGFSELSNKYIGNIEIPTKARLTDYCIFDGIIYYSIDYYGAIMMDLTDNIDDKKSKIYEKDINTGNSKVIYEGKDGISRYDNLYVTTSKIVWTEIKEKESVMYVLEKDGSNLEQIYRKELPFTKIAVTNKYIFWIDKSSQIKECKSIYRYDFETKDIMEIVTGICEDSSNNVVCYDNRITVYENKGTNHIVSVYDFNGSKRYFFESDDRICNAICNSKMCVWINKGEEGLRTTTIVINDLINNKIYKLEKEHFVEIALIENQLLINDRELFSILLGENKEKCVTVPDNIGLVRIIKVDTYGNVSFIRIDDTAVTFDNNPIVSVNVIK